MTKYQRRRLFSLILAFEMVIFFSITLSNPPFCRLNLFFANYIPLYTDIISIPYRIFGMYISLGFSMLVGYVLVKIYDLLHKKELFRIARRWRLKVFWILALMIVVLLSGIYVFPLWTGSVFHPGNKVSKIKYNILKSSSPIPYNFFLIFFLGKISSDINASIGIKKLTNIKNGL
ncbi:hypothetical protein ES703_63373 [subsurface metagenome]